MYTRKSTIVKTNAILVNWKPTMGLNETRRTHQNRPVRVVKVKKKRPKVTAHIPDEQPAVPLQRPTRQSLAFHRDGNNLKVIPLVEKRILQNKVKRGVFEHDEQNVLEIKDTSKDKMKNIDLKKLSRGLGRVTFEHDGSINIRLVDTESDPRNPDHNVLEADSDTTDNNNHDTNTNDNNSDLYDSAGNSRADLDDNTQQLKLWTYDDLVLLGEKLTMWMRGKAYNKQPKGFEKCIDFFCIAE